MFVLTALVYPAVLAFLCVGAGLLVDRLSGGFLPASLLVTVGAAALIALSQLTGGAQRSRRMRVVSARGVPHRDPLSQRAGMAVAPPIVATSGSRSPQAVAGEAVAARRRRDYVLGRAMGAMTLGHA